MLQISQSAHRMLYNFFIFNKELSESKDFLRKWAETLIWKHFSLSTG